VAHFHRRADHSNENLAAALTKAFSNPSETKLLDALLTLKANKSAANELATSFASEATRVEEAVFAESGREIFHDLAADNEAGIQNKITQLRADAEESAAELGVPFSNAIPFEDLEHVAREVEVSPVLHGSHSAAGAGGIDSAIDDE